jgi:hypothetical protein
LIGRVAGRRVLGNGGLQSRDDTKLEKPLGARRRSDARGSPPCSACGLCTSAATRPRSGFDCRIGCDEEPDELRSPLSKPGFDLPGPRTSLATRSSSAWATFPCALRSFNVSLSLPKLDGAARSGCTRLPLSFFFLLFLLFVVMRLDGEEHGRAQHEQFKRNKDYGNPIHDFLNGCISSLDNGSSRIGCCMRSSFRSGCL